MEKHDNVVKDLNEEFNKVDKAYRTSEMRVFGKNTGRIFRELDVIRRKQIKLASDHVSLKAINGIPPAHLSKQQQTNKTAAVATNGEELFSSSKSFDKKEVMLKNMMEKLDDLTQAMDRFKKISELDYKGDDTLISSEDNIVDNSRDNSLGAPTQLSTQQ